MRPRRGHPDLPATAAFQVNAAPVRGVVLDEMVQCDVTPQILDGGSTSRRRVRQARGPTATRTGRRHSCGHSATMSWTGSGAGWAAERPRPAGTRRAPEGRTSWRGADHLIKLPPRVLNSPDSVSTARARRSRRASPGVWIRAAAKPMGTSAVARRSPRPGSLPAVHEQAMRRLTAATGLVPVEFPTTRMLGASPRRDGRRTSMRRSPIPRSARCSPPSAATTRSRSYRISSEAAVVADPKLFVGYSDNTNLLNLAVVPRDRGFYGGSTQVHLGPGPQVDTSSLASLRAALLTGETPRDHRSRGVRGLRARTGTTRGHSSSSATANPPNRGPGRVPTRRSPVAPGVAASKSSSGS